MATGVPRLGITMPRSFAPRDVIDLARHAEDAGMDDVWVIEDCFFTSGPPLAAAVLAVTERVHVGVGILPAVIGTAALTAMEAATLAEVGPGRVTIGIGHGVQEWMDHTGVRPSSPVGTLTAVVDPWPDPWPDPTPDRAPGRKPPRGPPRRPRGRQKTLYPPSMTTTSPVRNDDASLASHTIVGPSSSGVATRCIGASSIHRARNRSSSTGDISVRT